MRYNEHNKLLALGLYYRRPSAYLLLAEQFCLPCESTLRTFIGCMNVRTELDTDFVSTLRIRAKWFGELDRHVVLLFHGMSLRSSLYDSHQDRTTGYVDISDFSPPSTAAAKSAVQFMVHGVCSKWKQPLGHFLVGNLLPSDVQQMLKGVIQLLQDMDLRVSAVMCDQESGHRVCQA